MTKRIGMQGYDYGEENAWTALGGGVPAATENKDASVHDLDRKRRSRRGGRAYNEGSDSELDPEMQGEVTAEDIERLSDGMRMVRQMRKEIADGQRDPNTGEIRIITEADKAEREGRLF